MLVTWGNFETVLDDLRDETFLAIDTETTGLRPYHGDRFFSIQISTFKEKYYFNFKEYEGLNGQKVLGRLELQPLQYFLFNDETKVWFIHNASFDLAMLANQGLKLKGEIHDTQSIARIEFNDHLKYGLSECAARLKIPEKKDVKSYLLENKLWEWKNIPGKKKRVKNFFFEKVPFSLMQEYGEHDADITLQVGMHQRVTLERMDNETKSWPHLAQVFHNELQLTKTVFQMEQLGVRLDLKYCERAIEYEKEREERYKKEFKEQSGKDFKDSKRIFSEVFVGETFKYTDKGNPSFDSPTLRSFSSPLARTVLDIRDAKSKSDFYNGFLYHADGKGIIHTSFHQSGTATGRFSSSNPNLQNLTKEEGDDLKAEFVIRRALIPREDYFFAMFDFDQMEYRLMLDYAGDKDLISKIKGGLDVHQATADVAGISRPRAKTTNFGILYGAGDEALSEMLRITPLEARALKNKVVEAAPGILEFIDQVTHTAKMRGFIFNWFGRRSYFPNKALCYKAPNYTIQGGCADIVKIAMNRVAEMLKHFKSRLVLQIHDELVLEVHHTEAWIISEVKLILEEIYPYKHLPLTCGADHSFKSLADKIKGYPNGSKTGDDLSKENCSEASGIA